MFSHLLILSEFLRCVFEQKKKIRNRGNVYVLCVLVKILIITLEKQVSCQQQSLTSKSDPGGWVGGGVDQPVLVPLLDFQFILLYCLPPILHGLYLNRLILIHSCCKYKYQSHQTTFPLLMMLLNNLLERICSGIK